MTQASLFADLSDAAPILPARIAEMYRLYGYTAGAACGTCANLTTAHAGTTWHKCRLMYQSASAATDVRRKWPACGRWEPEDQT